MPQLEHAVHGTKDSKRKEPWGAGDSPTSQSLHPQLTDRSILLPSDRLSVPNEIIRVLVAGRGIIPCGEPVIKSMMTRGRLGPVLSR